MNDFSFDTNALISLLKAEVVPTMGCTEAEAVALSAAQASEMLAGKIDRLEVRVSAGIYKNCLAVGIPGTELTGLEAAAALGAIKQQPQRQLAVLSRLTAQDIAAAKDLLAANKVEVIVDEGQDGIWIKTMIEADGNDSKVIIKGSYTHVVSIEKNGAVLYSQAEQTPQKLDCRQVLQAEGMTIGQIIQGVNSLPTDKLAFLLESIDMNLHAALVGIIKKPGLGVGAELDDLMVEGILADDLVNYAKRLVAGAVDMRFSGEQMYMMGNAGSVTCGIIVSLTVYAVAQRLKLTEDKVVFALAIGYLVTIYSKVKLAGVSALCECALVSGVGASAAITWMLGGDDEAVEGAIKNVISGMTSMFCDGFQAGCALKLSVATGVIVEASLLAQRHIVVPENRGIVSESILKTMDNLSVISKHGMKEVEKEMLKLILDKDTEQRIS